ncbi:basic proline-rich protein-like [Dromiciops gliroides]|uniref:basic proline-rich protein-like n=1 Tax=Dromiciops gliroides TaxID=33562 RepID=UPI001CC478C7|nr:basic proline-rich protein-like [Dromiciops gliroides]
MPIHRPKSARKPPFPPRSAKTQYTHKSTHTHTQPPARQDRSEGASPVPLHPIPRADARPPSRQVRPRLGGGGRGGGQGPTHRAREPGAPGVRRPTRAHGRRPRPNTRCPTGRARRPPPSGGGSVHARAVRPDGTPAPERSGVSVCAPQPIACSPAPRGRSEAGGGKRKKNIHPPPPSARAGGGGGIGVTNSDLSLTKTITNPPHPKPRPNLRPPTPRPRHSSAAARCPRPGEAAPPGAARLPARRPREAAAPALRPPRRPPPPQTRDQLRGQIRSRFGAKS